MHGMLPNRMRRIIALVCIALLLCAVPAESEGTRSGVLFRTDDWVIVQSGATVYRDPELTQPWTRLPGCIVKRCCDFGNGCTWVSNGKRQGYMKSEDLSNLAEGVGLYAACNTRAYQGPSLKSRWVKVRQGVDVELIAVQGSCAKVQRDGIIAYMYIGHLRPIGSATAM